MRRILILATVAISLVASAHAQGSAQLATYAPADTDSSVRILNLLFTDASSTVSSAFAAFMSVINLFSVALGTLMFTYFAVVGTINTAQDGELMGKKWSSMWIPVRYVSVTVLMVPGVSGFSTAQHGMLWLARMGAGAASYAWTAAASHIAGGGDAQSTRVSPEAGSNLDLALRTIWRAEACATAYRAYFKLAPADFGRSWTSTQDGGYVARWGATNGINGLAADACGTLTTQSYTPPTLSPLIVYSDMGAQSPVVDAATPLEDQAAMSRITSAERDAVDLVASLLSQSTLTTIDIACQQSCDADGKSTVENAINRAGQVYSGAMSGPINAVTQSAKDKHAVVQSLTKDGWIKAGAVMYSLASIESQTSTLQTWVPTVSSPPEGAETPLGITSSPDIYAESWESQLASPPATTLGKSIMSPGRSLARWLGTLIGGDPRNPKHALLQLKNSGDVLMDVCATAMTALGLVGKGMAGKVAGGLVSAGSLLGPVGAAAGAAIKGILEYGMYLVLPMYAVGITLSLVIPLQPVTLWLGSVMGWFIAIFEAILAAPVWLVAHLHPEGGDLSGKATVGYLILLEVVMRPVWMIGGLLAALVLSDIMVRLAGIVFWESVDSVQSDTLTGPVSVIVLALLYCTLCFTLVRTAFGMIHDVPATIMRWIGGQHATHDKGAQFGQAASTAASIGAQRGEVIGGRLAASIGSAAGEASSAASRPIDKRVEGTIFGRDAGND